MPNSHETNDKTPPAHNNTPANRRPSEPLSAKGAAPEASIAVRKTKRRRARMIRRASVLLGSVVVILLLAWGITSIITAGQSAEPVAPSASAPTASGASAVASGEPKPDNTAWNFVGPVPQTINNMALLNPDYRMIALPENGRVDMSYFSTVTFVGDSLTQGFQIYSQGIPNAHYCAYKGIGPKQMYDGSIQRRQDGEQEIPMDALVASAPANVYIQLGANAMVSLDDESILAYYREMLAAMRAALPPETGYYIQSLTPVRPDNNPGFDINRILALNNRLAQMAFEENLYFLDLTEPLAGDDGFLREDFAGGDGYHLSPSGYAAWTDYLVTHTAYRPGTPYLEGSPFYIPPAPEPAPVSSVAPVADPAATPPADPAATPPADPAATPPADPAATPPADPAAAPPA